MDSIKIKFMDAGRYGMESADGRGQIDLGECSSAARLDQAVQITVNAGSGDEDWSGWRTIQTIA